MTGRRKNPHRMDRVNTIALILAIVIAGVIAILGHLGE